MTISIPALPPETVPAGANPAGAETGLSAPADGFDQFMSAEAGVSAGEPAGPEAVAPNAATNEQAAVLAASLLWSPLPLLVETPPPAPELNLETGAGTASMSPAPILPGATASQPAPLAANESAKPAAAPAPEFRAPARPEDKAPVMPASAEVPAMQPEAGMTAENPATTPAAAPATETAENAQAAVGSGSVPPVELALERGAPRRPLRSAAGREEKIAAAFNPLARGLPQAGMALPKTFVSDTQQEVREGEGFVGTSGAKSKPVMPFVLADHPSAPAALASAPAAPDWQHLQFDLTAATEPAQQARDTVATVMSVIDAQEKPEAAATRTVTMDFDFGGERLAVRVEYRDGMVHAHFRTQSLELRSALAQEWSHVSAAPENVLRLVEPVFVTSSRSEQAASFNADGGAARQQPQPQAETPAAFFSRPASAGFRSSPAADAPEAPRLRHLSTALHLQAVA